MNPKWKAVDDATPALQSGHNALRKATYTTLMSKNFQLEYSHVNVIEIDSKINKGC